MLLTYEYKAARTLTSLVLILPIVLILLAKCIAADQVETLRAHAKCISPESRQSSYRISPDLGGLSSTQCCNPPGKTDCSKYEKSALMLSQHFPRSNDGLQYQSPTPAKRGIISNLAISISDLVVVSNTSALTSFIYTQFYRNMTLLWTNREQWIGPAVRIIIFSCGAIKLTLEIMAAERPVSWQMLQDFVNDFARMMIHVTKHVVIASLTGVALTALGIFFITLQIMENQSREDLLTRPLS